MAICGRAPDLMCACECGHGITLVYLREYARVFMSVLYVTAGVQPCIQLQCVAVIGLRADMWGGSILLIK